MASGNYIFSDVTLLITHYNRSNSLKRLLEAFVQLGCSFGDVIVSDDGSQVMHLQNLNALQVHYKFRLIPSPINRGLANNLNKGQKAVRTPYTLYIQEDFVPQATFAHHFQEALSMMQQELSIDLVRFYAYFAYPYLEAYKYGFSEMKFSPWAIDYNKIYCYSDHPHLRRSTFNSKFGRYVEGIKGDRMEYRMCISFLQKKGRGLFYNDFRSLFSQQNDLNEPSTMKRSEWKQSPHPLVAIARYLYRQIKYNFDIQFMIQQTYTSEL